MDNDSILDLIKKFESGGRNIVNFMYGPGHTAQGYYQITDTNWKDYGPKAGVDVSKYPNARAAPEEEQRKVASHLLTETPKGVRNWSDFNPRLKAALSSKDMPQDQDQEFTLQELQAEKARRQSLKETSMSQKSVMGGKVVPPKSDDRGFFEKWASSPDLGSYGLPGITGSIASEVIPGIKQILRGTRGYRPFDMPPNAEYSGPARAADTIEGVMRAGSPFAIPGMIANPAGAMAGIGLGIMGGVGGQKGAEYLGADPDVQRLTGDVTGLMAGGLGSKLGGPKSPSGGGGMTPRMRSLAKAGLGYRGGHLMDAIFPDEGPPPKGPVEPPTPKGPSAPKEKPPTPPTRAESTEMLKRGTIDENRFLEHEAARNSTPQVAKEHLANAKAKIAEEAPPPPQPTATIVPEAKMPPPINMTGTPPEVTLPPGLKIKTSTPVQLPVGPPPSGTMGPQLNPPVPPVAPNPPIPGTPGPQGLVGAPPSPLAGPAPTGTPLGQQLTPNLPVGPPTSNIPPAPGLGPVAPPVIGPKLPPAPVPKATPLGIMPPSEFEARGIKVADAAEKLGKTPPRTSNQAVLKKWKEITGLEDLTKTDMTEGRRIHDQRIRARERRD